MAAVSDNTTGFAGDGVHLMEEDESRKGENMWIRGKEDSDGWFTLIDQTSGLFLTSKNEASTTIEGI